MLQPPQLMDARLTSDHGGDSIVRPHQQGFLDARPPYTSPAGYGRQHAPDDNKLKIVERPFNSIGRSEEHTSELQSLMRISYAVFCLKKQNSIKTKNELSK